MESTFQFITELHMERTVLFVSSGSEPLANVPISSTHVILPELGREECPDGRLTTPQPLNPEKSHHVLLNILNSLTQLSNA